MGDAGHQLTDSDIAELQRFRFDRGIRRHHGEKLRHVIADFFVERNARRGRQQLRQAQHIVEMLAHVLGVHLGALLFPRIQV